MNHTALAVWKKLFPRRYNQMQIPLKSLCNLPQRHEGYKSKTFAVKIEGKWFGITLAFITHSNYESKPFDQKMTPYTADGRKRYISFRFTGNAAYPPAAFCFDAAAQAAGFPLPPVAENRIFAHRRAAQGCASRDAAHLSQAPDRGVPKRASDGMNLFVGDDVTQWVIRKALYTSSRRSRLGRS